MRKLSWFLPLISLVVFACAERQDTPVVAPEATKQPDVEGVFDGIAIKVFSPDNPYTRSAIDEVTRESAVQLEKQRFENAGYLYSSEHSFVAEGFQADGKRLDLAVVSMKNARYEDRDAIHLLCMRADDRFVVVPVRIIFGPEVAAAERAQIADGVWLEVIDPLGTSLGVAASPAAWSWKKFGGCLGERLVVSGTSCALRCLFTNAGYLHCMGVCGAGAALASIAGCTFQQL